MCTNTQTHAYLCMYVYTSVNSRRTKDSCGKPLVKSTKRIICKQKCEKGKWFTLSIDIKQFGCLSMTVLGPRPCPQTRPSTRLLTSCTTTSTSTLTSVICVCAHISCFDSLCLVWFGFLQYYKVYKLHGRIRNFGRVVAPNFDPFYASLWYIKYIS